jgi:4-amino-4-deoxy-L-arabinose transferase-like glycosyltransferase
MQKQLAVIILFALAGLLRLYALGYSDYQGDEIKALYNPKEATSLAFFLDQRKGPMQFLVTAAVKGISHDYANRTLVRLPFALAGLGSVCVFYYLAKALFTQKIAVYATIFFSTNGFLVAFSRLVQYQSLVIFFGLLAVYWVHKYAAGGRTRFLILAAVSLAISILAHYDGVFFVPIIFGLFYVACRTNRRSVRRLVVPTLLFLALTGAFYVPFALSVAQSTTDYWAGRITGDVSGKLSSSRYLFSVYQPIYVLHVYTLLGLAGFALLTLLSLAKLARFTLPAVFAGEHSTVSLPVLVSILIWFAVPFVLLERVIYIPGTHIYTYLIPTFLAMGSALAYASAVSTKLFGRFVAPAGVLLLAAFLVLQAYYVFVDHTTEYPWENKQFLVWTLPKPTPIFHLSMFGFPYYRHWDELGSFIRTKQQAQFYTTNERVSIARYHIALDKAGDKAGYYVYITNPQTFTNEITNARIAAWVHANAPVVQYTSQGRVVSAIYLVPDYFIL